MKYGDYYVDAIPDNGIERTDDQGKTVICNGYFCQLYDDPDYENRVDYFCLAVGHEIPDDSESSLENGIRWYLGIATPTEERRQEADETTDRITAEDLVEQAVYAAHAPDCCADRHAENMLGMLGANILEEEIYHDEEDCPKLKMDGMV